MNYFNSENEIIISDIVKEYPKMFKIVIYHDDYKIIKPDPSIRREAKSNNKINKHIADVHRSVRKTKEKIKDIMLSNTFDYWCTFTFNCRECFPKCTNDPCTCVRSTCKRFDMVRCHRVLSNWFRNQRVKGGSPDLKYLAVPEHHKDGAIHFHVLLGNFNGRLRPTKKKTKYDQVIYNALGYYSGFTEFVKIGERFDTKNFDEDYKRITNYISKYITKDMPKIFNQKRYLCSQGLDRPTVTRNGVRNLLGLSYSSFKGIKPAFINDLYEIREIPKVGYLDPYDENTKLFNIPSIKKVKYKTSAH